MILQGMATASGRQIGWDIQHDWCTAILRALAGAARNDLPLVTALRALAEPPSLPYFRGLRRERLQRLTRDLAEGRPLSQALTYCLGSYLPAYAEDALAAAEEQGCVSQVLSILADNASRRMTASRHLGALLVYPIVQFATAFGVISGLMVFIVPKFAKIFDEMAAEPVPWAMQIVIGVSTVLLRCLPLAVIGVPAAVVGILVATRFRLFHRLGVHVPLIGPYVRRMALLEFSQGMLLLTASGRDTRSAAALSASASSYPIIVQRASAMTARIREGVPWGDAWQGMRLGQPVHDWIVRNAASLEDPVNGFRTLSEWLAEEIVSTFSRIATLSESAFILGNAAVIGFVVFALHSALWQLLYVASDL